ncbi:MAG: PfkB family carbohydrate kinase [Proteobacteria bacterium]|nr:PfkB family carbohydrate kinase [Pseudomonadota bacterium]
MTAKFSKSRWQQIIGRFPECRVLVLGDLILDRYLFGRVRRVSPEAPVPVVELEGGEDRPGGAGNAVMNLASLQGKVWVAGVIGQDKAGERLLEILKGQGIPRQAIISDPSRVTPFKTRVVAIPQHHQVVRIDQEKTSPVSIEIQRRILGQVERVIGQVDAVIVSDYGKGMVSPGIMAGLLRIAGKRKIPVGVDPKPGNFPLYRGVSFLTPNHVEAGEIVGFRAESDPEVEKAGKEIIGKTGCQSLLITRGEKGLTLFERGARSREPGAKARKIPAPGPVLSVIHIPTAAREVFDVSGAGDTVIAAYTLALTAGAAPQEAAVIANVAAGLVVGKFGTASISQKELMEAI